MPPTMPTLTAINGISANPLKRQNERVRRLETL